MTRYTSATDADREAMLDAIGVGSIDELFEDDPRRLRLGAAARPPGRAVRDRVLRPPRRRSPARNADAESEVCFLGAGMYDHYVPAIVDAITSARSS